MKLLVIPVAAFQGAGDNRASIVLSGCWKTTIPKEFFGGTCRDVKGAEVEYKP